MENSMEEGERDERPGGEREKERERERERGCDGMKRRGNPPG